MPVKILVISNYTQFHSCRPEAEIFIGLARLGFEVHVMTFRHADYWDIMEREGMKMVDFHPKKKFDRQEIAFIHEYLLREKIQIMELFNGVANVNGIQAAKGTPVKVILYRGYTGNIYWFDPSAYLKYLHARVDIVLCNSIGVEELIRRQSVFTHPRPVTINKGHRLEWYADVVPQDVRAQFGLPPDALVLVSVANNRKMKGVPYLLKALTLLPAEWPIHLLLIGSNMDTKENLTIIRKGKIEHKIHFTGFQDDPLGLVAGSDAFVLASLFGESITKSVLEAMSLGVAPIITDIPGNRELVVHGENGLVVKAKSPKSLADAIRQLWENRDLCHTFGKASQKRITTHLHTDLTIARYAVLFRELTG